MLKPPKGQNWQFRDQRVPARVCYLLRDGVITSTDLMLLWVIDSLVKPETDEPGMGCFATNGYLARAVKKNPSYIARRLSYLSNKQLVIITQYDGQRYLELEWSRTQEERASLSGGYGKAYRKAYARTTAPQNQPAGGRADSGEVRKSATPGEPVLDKCLDLRKSKGSLDLRKSKGDKSNEEVLLNKDYFYRSKSNSAPRCGERYQPNLNSSDQSNSDSDPSPHRPDPDEPPRLPSSGNNQSTPSKNLSDPDERPRSVSPQTSSGSQTSKPPARTLHYAQARSHKRNEKPQGGFFSESPQGKRRCLDPIYYEWEQVLYTAACAKADIALPRGNIFARVQCLRRVHKQMDHPGDLKKILDFYAKNDILRRDGSPLVLYSPKMLGDPGVLGWILNCMADAGLRDVHYLDRETAEKHGHDVRGGGVILSDEEILYYDEDDDVEIERLGLLLRIRQGKRIKSIDLDTSLRNGVLYSNSEKGVTLEREGKELTVRIGKETLYRDLRGVESEM